MKRKSAFILLLLALASIGGVVLSKASLIGRVGISLFYRQYKFLKVWWQAGLAVFFVWMIVFVVQDVATRRMANGKAKTLHIASILIGLIGLFFTYKDFRNTISHRWLGERFHLGGYLFWIGWIVIGVFFLTQPRFHKPVTSVPITDKNPVEDAANNRIP